MDGQGPRHGTTDRPRTRLFVKRVFDVVVAGTVLVLTLPILIVAAVAIELDSRGPVICRRMRVGKDGVRFEMFELRSTIADTTAASSELEGSDERSGRLRKVGAGARVTRVGRVLRWTSIDELPRLWNVVRGEMSLIGPRPALASEIENSTKDQHENLRLLPGITGTWQESDRPEAG